MATSLGLNDTSKVSLGNTLIFSKISIGNEIVYSAGNTVTYYVDTNVVYQEEVDADETVLSPKTFTPTKEGWEFVGWRKDTVASGDVLSSLTMDNDPITLYAVYQQGITLSYDANGGSGVTTVQTGIRYYSSAGTYVNPVFIVADNGFSKTNYSFVQWRLNTTTGTAYAPGSTLTLSSNSTMYAEWKYLGSPFYIVQNGVINQGLSFELSNSGRNSGSIYPYYWAVGNTPSYVNLNLSDEKNNGWGVISTNNINTKGCSTLSITLSGNTGGPGDWYYIGGVWGLQHPGYIWINDTRSTLQDCSDKNTHTWNISGLSTIKLSFHVGTFAYGTGNIVFQEIRLY